MRISDWSSDVCSSDLVNGNNFGGTGGAPYYAKITAIPSGYEGVLTLRGGTISTFTDGDFLLNQSRLFTRQGGDIIMWSSNADLNAGQGPKPSEIGNASCRERVCRDV